jgi:hypothetical protein
VEPDVPGQPLLVHVELRCLRRGCGSSVSLAICKTPTTDRGSLGRTLVSWKHQIAAWHQARVSSGPIAAVNNLVKRVKRVALAFTGFRNYRIRSLLYAGKPNWDLLATIAPC